jgi:hypothetical protein
VAAAMLASTGRDHDVRQATCDKGPASWIAATAPSIRDFGNNEMRTMRMAQEVYAQMIAFSPGTTAQAWGDIEATVRAFARTGQAAAAAQNRWINEQDVASWHAKAMSCETSERSKRRRVGEARTHPAAN